MQQVDLHNGQSVVVVIVVVVVVVVVVLFSVFFS